MTPLRRAGTGPGSGEACTRRAGNPFFWPAPHPIGDCRVRRRACVAGKVLEVRTEREPGELLAVQLADDSGSLWLVFLGRREIPGIAPGARLQVEGMAGRFRGVLAVVNPRYRFLE